MKTILLVDDSASVRQQVSAALGQAGYQVIQAVDGAEGLEQIRKNLSQIAMVICDVNMPRMNGLELVETVGRDPQLSVLPVLMLTSEGESGLIERAKKAGAKGWLVKPFKIPLLLSAVKRLAAG